MVFHLKRGEKMELAVNGKRMATGCATVHELLTQLGLDPGIVAVERNLEIVPKQMYESMILCDGDRIEIVHLVGGG
jgi:thiamine biosynthesis protein ThiS